MIIEKKGFYKPSEIVYNRYQLTTFLLPNLSLLLSGDWPRESTGYTNTDYPSPYRPSVAYYCNAIDISAEIDVRLKMIGDESDLLIQLYETYDLARETGTWLDWDNTLKAYNEASKRWHITPERAIRRANKMLRYISGVRRPEVNYETWKRNGQNKHPVYNLISSVLECVFST